jgi:hypothetical protein
MDEANEWFRQPSSDRISGVILYIGASYLKSY